MSPSVVVGRETGQTVDVVDSYPGLPSGYVMVRITPSFRGLAHDLASYPSDWVQVAA